MKGDVHHVPRIRPIRLIKSGNNPDNPSNLDRLVALQRSSLRHHYVKAQHCRIHPCISVRFSVKHLALCTSLTCGVFQIVRLNCAI